MNIEEKKKILRKIILQNRAKYDLSIYRLLDSDCLDNILLKINNILVVSNVNSKEIISSDEQFIALLNRFIYVFKQTFSNINIFLEYFIQTIISTNEKEVSEYLLSKYYLGDNDYIDYYNRAIYSIIISNFIKNSRYLGNLNQLLKDNKIKIKKKNYSLNEIFIIKDIMSNIVFCNNESDLIFFFSSIDSTINYNIKVKERTKSKTNEEIINYYSDLYNLILSEYYRKKEYLIYFKN